MLVEWYWRNQSGTYGPFTEEELIQLAHDGEIGKHCEVRLGEDGRWYPATKVKGLFTTTPADGAGAAASPDGTTQVEEDTGSSASVRLKRAKPLKPKVRAVAPAESSIIQTAPPPPAANHAPASGFAVQTEDGNSAASVPVSQRPRRKGSSVGMLLTVALLGMAMAAVLTFALLWSGSGDSDLADASSGDAATAPANASIVESEPTASARSTDAEANNAELLEQVTKFHDATRSRIKLNAARVQVQEAWLSPAEDGESEQLFVKITITNLSDTETWSYSSFNGTGTEGLEAQAHLFDGDEQACQLIPVADRKQQWCPPTVPLAPGQTVDDVLVFAKPTGKLEHLRLVLPRPAIALSGAPMGYQLSEKMIGSGPRETPTTEPAPDTVATSDVAQPSAAATETAVATADQEMPDTNEAPPVSAPPTETETDTGKPAPNAPQNGTLPATIDGLLDSINSFDEKKQPSKESSPDMPRPSDEGE